MNSVDFVMYCAGASAVFVSGAVAFKLIVRTIEPFLLHVFADDQASKPERAPEPIIDPLNLRLKAIQDTRFGAPITTRTLTPDMGPPIRPYSRPRQPDDFTHRAPPGPTKVKLPPRAALRTVPAVREREVVVSLPMKQKPDAPKKDE